MVARLGTFEISRVHRLVLYREQGSSLIPAPFQQELARLAHWLKETGFRFLFILMQGLLLTLTSVLLKIPV